MEKKVYMPMMAELYKMQESRANVYSYLIAKVIESLVIDGTIYYNKGFLKNTYKYFQENSDIVRASCMMYPEILEDKSESNKTVRDTARYDSKLAELLISNPIYTPIAGLDKLALFSDTVQYSDAVIRKTILLLADNLSKYPRYRFEYISNRPVIDGTRQEVIYENGSLLDDIFSCNLNGGKIPNHYLFDKSNSIIQKLCEIEPGYIFHVDEAYFAGDKYRFDKLLCESVYKYTSRYAIDSMTGTEYIGKDILTNPNDDVKRLIKCIDKHK